MKSNWLFDKPRANVWRRGAAVHLAMQSPCLPAVTESHCDPQWDFLRLLRGLVVPEEGMERVQGQTCDFSRDPHIS